jgi:hypothetical protein
MERDNMAATIVLVDVSFALRFLDCLASAATIASGCCGRDEGGGSWRVLSSAALFGSGCCDVRRRNLGIVVCLSNNVPYTRES